MGKEPVTPGQGPSDPDGFEWHTDVAIACAELLECEEAGARKALDVLLGLLKRRRFVGEKRSADNAGVDPVRAALIRARESLADLSLDVTDIDRALGRCLCQDVMSGQPGRDIDPRGCPVHDLKPDLPASDGRDQRESVEVPQSLDSGGIERRPSEQGVTAGETATFKVGQRVRIVAGEWDSDGTWVGRVGTIWTLVPGGAWVTGISKATLFFRDSELSDQWDDVLQINMQSERPKLRGGHAHGCPICYENVPCDDECSIEPDLELDITPRGSYVTCDDCAAKVAPRTSGAGGSNAAPQDNSTPLGGPEGGGTTLSAPTPCKDAESLNNSSTEQVVDSGLPKTLDALADHAR